MQRVALSVVFDFQWFHHRAGGQGIVDCGESRCREQDCLLSLISWWFHNRAGGQGIVDCGESRCREKGFLLSLISWQLLHKAGGQGFVNCGENRCIEYTVCCLQFLVVSPQVMGARYCRLWREQMQRVGLSLVFDFLVVSLQGRGNGEKGFLLPQISWWFHNRAGRQGIIYCEENRWIEQDCLLSLISWWFHHRAGEQDCGENRCREQGCLLSSTLGGFRQKIRQAGVFRLTTAQVCR